MSNHDHSEEPNEIYDSKTRKESDQMDNEATVPAHREREAGEDSCEIYEGNSQKEQYDKNHENDEGEEEMEYQRDDHEYEEDEDEEMVEEDGSVAEAHRQPPTPKDRGAREHVMRQREATGHPQQSAQRPYAQYPDQPHLGTHPYHGTQPTQEQRPTPAGQRYVPPKERGPQQVFWPTLVFVLVLAMAVGLVLVNEADNAEADDKDPSELVIEPGMVFFELKETEGESYLLEVSLFITNYGEKVSGGITIRGYAENKHNDIVYDNAETMTDPIPARQTDEVLLPITLPSNASYRIRIFLFEYDIITISGYGEVSLSAVSQTVLEFTSEKEEEQKVAGDDDDDDDSPGLSGVMAVATFAVMGYLFRSNRRGVS